MDDTFVDSTLFSSGFFLTNSLTALYMSDYMYCILFTCLFCTSIAFRTLESDTWYLLDQVCIYCVVLYGAYILYTKASTISLGFFLLIVSTFVATIVLFHYGKMVHKYCFSPDGETAHLYHSLLHTLSSVGHHCIILA